MVTFETKCYENDWELMLKTDYLDAMIKRCNYDFKKKVLYLNNISDLSSAMFAAELAVERKIIDEYYVVENFAAAALQYFDINIDSFNGGYYYSIAELVGIYLCKTPYLLHFSSDSIMSKNSSSDWIHSAIDEMSKNSKIICANPVWNFAINEAVYDSFFENKNWFFEQGFTDQCYLIPTKIYKDQIYHHKNKFSERYPKYGGELFEKRVDAYMRNSESLRITNKHSSYLNGNIPKTNFEDKLKWKEVILSY